MQEQEKEALRTEIYNQIMKDLREQEKTADLNKQSMNSNVGQEKQKKYRIVMGLSKSLWVAIIAPLTVVIIGNGILTHTWPISIQLPNYIPTSYTNFANLFVTFFLCLCVARLILGAFSPFRCQCGFGTWSPNLMLTHVEMKHVQMQNANKNTGFAERLLPPFRCQCGYDTRSSKRIKSHVEMKHMSK